MKNSESVKFCIADHSLLVTFCYNGHFHNAL